MHRTSSVLALPLLLLSLAACSPAKPAMPYPAAGSSSSAVTEEQAVSSTMPPAVAPRVMTVTVTNFAFAPEAIVVKKGERVTLAFRGVEGVHGVVIEGLGINVAVPPGETVTVDLPTNVVGTFSFRCSVPCGPGHKEMRGSIIIE